MEKGLFTKEREKFLIDLACSKLNFKNKWIERFKRPVIRLIVRYGDNSLIDQLPQQWKSDLMPIIDRIIVKDYENARLYINDLINKHINLKKVSEPTELELIDSLTRLIKVLITIIDENSKK